MAIIYTEKGKGLHIKINEAGYSFLQIDGIWQSSNDIAVQSIIDNYDPVPFEKEQKKAELELEFLKRIQVIFSSITSIGHFNLALNIILSIDVGSRTLTPDISSANNIYQAVLDANAVIDSFITFDEIKIYNTQSDPLWP